MNNMVISHNHTSKGQKSYFGIAGGGGCKRESQRAFLIACITELLCGFSNDDRSLTLSIAIIHDEQTTIRGLCLIKLAVTLDYMVKIWIVEINVHVCFFPFDIFVDDLCMSLKEDISFTEKGMF